MKVCRFFLIRVSALSFQYKVLPNIKLHTILNSSLQTIKLWRLFSKLCKPV